MADRLDRYRGKRDAARTSEPVPEGSGGSGEDAAPRFVVQEHHATRLHWDLRLERDGVLVSWALPRYLPLAPGRNVVAIRTEDHPLEYVSFSGQIPAGEYGAGTMSIHDTGTYETIKWDERKVEVHLRGERLDASYALFPIERDGDPAADGATWMVHRMDAGEHPAPQEDPPDRIAPMLARAGTLPTGEGWRFEVKWDGARTLVSSQPGEWCARSRSLADVSVTFPELSAVGRGLGVHRAVLDGEVVALESDGTPSFARLQRRLGRTEPAKVKRVARDAPVRYVVFDVLWLDGEDLMGLSYDERRARLDALDLERHGGPVLMVPEAHDDGAALLEAAAGLGLEGVVAKRRDCPYTPGRRSDGWVKVKLTGRIEAVIAGWTAGEGRRRDHLGALVLGLPDPETGELRYAGKVGTGFKEDDLVELRRLLADREVAQSPLAESTGGLAPPNGTAFVRPDLACEIEFTEMSPDGVFRHPSYKGLVARAEDGEEPGARDGAAPGARRRGRTGGSADGTLVRAAGRELRLTNLDKPLWPDGTTKAATLEYAAQVAEVLLPHLHGRPLTLRRWPDGTQGPTFYEKRAPRHRPDWVETVAVEHEAGVEEHLLAAESATLVWLANLAAIELHTPLHRVPPGATPDAERCADLVAFDLDPGAPATAAECASVALLLRGMLEGLGLDAWVKASGSKGLQVYLPLATPTPYARTRAFAKAVAEVLAQEEPQLVVARQAKALRTGRVLVDWMQNDRSKTTVSVYSLRAAHARPTVSAPLTWDEVEALADDGDPASVLFSPPEVLARIERDGDLFAGVLDTDQELPAA